VIETDVFEKIISKHQVLFGGVSAQDISLVEPASTNLIFFFQHASKKYALKVMPCGAKTEFAMMEEAGKHIEVPKPLSYGRIDDDEYLLMQFAPGNNAQDVMPSAISQMRATFIDLSAKVLAKLHRSTLNIREAQKLKTKRLLNSEDVRSSLELLGIKDWRGISRLRSMEADISANGTSLVHGDYIPSNIMVDKHGITGVIDWEDAFWGSPLYDVGFSLFVLRAIGFDARLFLRSYIDEWSKPVQTDLNSQTVIEPPKDIMQSLPYYEALAAVQFFVFNLGAKMNPKVEKLINRPSNNWQLKAITAAEKFAQELAS
jgi:aminoglycoside phosphotransferase (APT) family kinase protein